MQNNQKTIKIYTETNVDRAAIRIHQNIRYLSKYYFVNNSSNCGSRGPEFFEARKTKSYSVEILLQRENFVE